MAAVQEINVKSAINSIKYVDLSERTIVGIANLTNGMEIVESFSFRKLERVNKSIAQEIIKERIHHKVFEQIAGKKEAPAVVEKKKPGRPAKAAVVEDNDTDEAFNG
jgi:hypothetical protein